MLTCFLKNPSEQDVECKIVQYADRIWLNSDGSIDCLREFIISNESTTNSLTRVRMVLPFRSLLKLEDKSERFLDPNFLFIKSSFITGGYELINKDPIHKGGGGVINYDGFPRVKVQCNNTIVARQLSPHNATLIEIQSKEDPIAPRELRFIAISFSVSSLLDQMFGSSDIYSLTLSYFNGMPIKQAIEELRGDNSKLEIPAVKIYDKETKQGGFDVFLYLPPNLAGQGFSDKMAVSKHQFDGTEGPNRQKFIWRARFVFKDKDLLLMDKARFDLHGYINNPAKFEEMRSKISNIIETLKKNKKFTVIAIILSILALIKGFWPNIVSWIK